MITIHGRSGPFSARVNLPASKSISNRLLVLKYFAGDKLDIRNLSTADDTILLLTILELIDQYRSPGATGLLRIDTRNAGTVMRFLTSLLAVVPGHFLLTGSARMLERPVGPLVEALRTLGADIEHTDRNGYPPLLIRGHPCLPCRTILPRQNFRPRRTFRPRQGTWLLGAMAFNPLPRRTSPPLPPCPGLTAVARVAWGDPFASISPSRRRAMSWRSPWMA